MKKVLSFVLVLAMILGCTSMAFATAYINDEEAVAPFADAPNSLVATVLKDLGVLTGDEKGNANLDSQISRAELCTVIMRALGYESVGKVQKATKFVDVPKEHWASGYINYANSLGKVAGIDAKHFAPDNKVTGYEAVAFILKALGYADEHLEGEWPANFVAQADAIGVLGDFAPSDEYATREEVFTLLYNALDAKTVTWKKSDEYYFENAKTLGNILGINGTAATLYTTTDKAIQVPGEFENGFDYSEYVGKYVTVLSKGTEEMAIVDVLSKTLAGKFTAADKFKADDVTYTLVSDSTGETFLVENGTCAATTITVADFVGTSCSIEVKLNKTNAKKIDTVYSVNKTVATKKLVSKTEADGIANAYKSKVKASTTTLLDKTFNLTKSGLYYVPDETYFTVSGDVDSLKDIAKNDVVEITAFEGYKYEILVTRDSDTGVFQKKQGTSYTFDCGTYKFATTTFAGTYSPVNTDAASKKAFDLFLDKDGKIFFCTTAAVKSTAVNAYVLAINNAGSTADWSDASAADKQVKLYNIDGSVETLSFNNKKVPTPATDAFTLGAFVAYTLDEDGKIDSFATDATLKTGEVLNAEKNTVSIGDPAVPYHYASDITVIFTSKDTTVKKSSADYYDQATVADLVGKKWDAATSFYKTNKDGDVALIVVKDAGYGAAAKIATEYAFVVGTGYDDEAFISVAGPTFEEEYLYLASGGAFLTAGNVLYEIVLEDGEVLTMAAAGTKCSEGAFVDASKVVIDDDILTVSGSSFILADDVTVYVWNADDEAFDLGELDDLYSAATVKLYNVVDKTAKGEFTGKVDTIVLVLRAEEE